MTQQQQISEALISSRNILLGGSSNEHILSSLEVVLEHADSITVLSTRKIVELCVPEVISQVRNSDFISAGMILNLIHNLPLDETRRQSWDIDYFLSIELPTFLDRFEEVISSRLIALFVCKHLACAYLPSSVFSE
ncbi:MULTISPECIES: hypothetical protein [unclassified Polaromonas]|uniref:hypothetical protein n=1 Tax=unclassified Polaromonas TaxID=2638319 RepID=UPI000F08C1D1|nr:MULTISPECIES: hypothetical protein [unclassified Polaromonas]AYQ29537.1 hypothetical protein DT070_16860 [Polaromonas sp. SP1]QGJ19347.1 hypothetical protein F7R28_13725 [Polaromonas sp. Pch-P]